MERSQDVQRLSAVFDEAAIDFEVLSLLTPHIFLTDNLRGIVGQELAFMINSHVELEGRYGAFVKDKMMQSRSWTPDEELYEMAESLTDSLRTICRMFGRTPYMLRYIKRDEALSKESWFEILSHIAEYFQVVKRKVIALSDDDYVNPDSQFDELSHAHEEAVLRVKELKAMLNAEIGERALQQSQGNAKIAKLTNEIAKLREQIETKQARTDSETSVALQEVEFSHERVISRLTQDLKQLQQQITERRTESLEKETKARKNLRRLEGEISECLANYDDNMISLTDEYAALKASFDEESARLADMKSQVQVLVAEREAVEFAKAEAQRIKDEKEQAENFAATKIQAIFRGAKTRKDLKKASKKKGKGKGKGKGKR